MADERVEQLLEKFEDFKQEIADLFSELGLGKDEVLRVHSAVNVAAAAVKSHGPHFGHDLNDDLAESPEDHPAVVGQGEKPPIELNDPAADPEKPAASAGQSPAAPQA